MLKLLKTKRRNETRFSKLDQSYVSEFESRVNYSNLEQQQNIALKNAIESQDVDAQVAAQEQIASFNFRWMLA